MDIKDFEREFAYTRWENACQDPTIFYHHDLRECRRPKNHEGVHASGFGPALKVWRNTKVIERVNPA